MTLLLFNDINKATIVIPDEKSVKRGIEIISSMFEKMTKKSFKSAPLKNCGIRYCLN